MIEWDGLPPSAAGSPSAHLLRHKATGREAPALWRDAEWTNGHRDFVPSHAAMFYEYVGPCLTPAEVEARELSAFETGAKVMRSRIEEAVRLAARQEEERIHRLKETPHA